MINEHDSDALMGAPNAVARASVALPTNNEASFSELNYTVAEALARLGTEWTALLVERWQHRGNPKPRRDLVHSSLVHTRIKLKLTLYRRGD